MEYVAQKSPAVLPDRRLCGAVPASVRIRLDGPVRGISCPVWPAGWRTLHAGSLKPAKGSAPDHRGSPGRGTGAAGRGAAGLSLHLRRFHARQPDRHGRKCGRQFQLAASLWDPPKSAEDPAPPAAADCRDPLPYLAEGAGSEAAAALEAGTGLLCRAPRTAADGHGTHVCWTGQRLFRLSYLHQCEHLHRQQL